MSQYAETGPQLSGNGKVVEGAHEVIVRRSLAGRMEAVCQTCAARTPPGIPQDRADAWATQHRQRSIPKRVPPEDTGEPAVVSHDRALQVAREGGRTHRLRLIGEPAARTGKSHPELELEQSYIDTGYGLLLGRLGSGLMSGNSLPGADRHVTHALRAISQATRARLEALLNDRRRGICFGRIDYAKTHSEWSGERYYIGREFVKRPNGDEHIVSWKAPVAAAFYEARTGRGAGLRQRRAFRTRGPQVEQIEDVHFLPDHKSESAAQEVRPEEITAINRSKGDEPPREKTAAGTPPCNSVPESSIPLVDELLVHELEREREGRLRDIVATIQADQDRIIRQPLQQLLLVQGGPGTGKTAIGLHRLSYLLFTYKDQLTADSVLVVGPNPVFIKFIRQVLPGLGDLAVRQIPVDNLISGVRVTADEVDEVAALKGDARMARVLHRYLQQRIRLPEEDIVINKRAKIPVASAGKAVEEVRLLARSHDVGRNELRRRWIALLRDGLSSAEIDEAGNAPQFQRALDRSWPTLSAEQLVRDVITGRRRLEAAASGLLSHHEQQLILRGTGGRVSEEQWTQADAVLIDEARHLLGGVTDRYEYMVVHEAQDLTPMQLRMLTRRCPRGHMTVLGDLAQATSAGSARSWADVLDHLPRAAPVRLEELSTGYRVPREIMTFANRLLREVDVGLPTTTSLRKTGVKPSVRREDPVLPGVTKVLANLSNQSGSVGVLATQPYLEEIEGPVGHTTSTSDAPQTGPSATM